MFKFFQKIKPTTPSKRNAFKFKHNEKLSKKPILKKKIKGQKTSAGKNNSGKITVYHKGGGLKQKYRIISFKRKNDSIGIVCSLEYDPNRTAFIASIFNYQTYKFFYIIAPNKLKIGDIVQTGLKIKPSIGNSLPISEISIGTKIHNVSIKFNKLGQLSRSAGAFALIKEKIEKYAIIELNSGELKKININCFASIGEVSNDLHFLNKLKKAGNSRWLNRRPTVRGVAMNPIDHPHGGGEGKKSGKKMTPWGKPKKVKNE